MNLAFCGTHSTGKTTLLNELVNTCEKKLFTITEVARKVITSGYPMGKDANINSYINYINLQLKAEQYAASKQYDILISDRTMLDPLVYALVNQALPRPFIPSYLIEMIEEIWKIQKEYYDLYIFFPIEFDMTSDGTRYEDEKYRMDVEVKTKELLIKNNINYISLTGSLDERVLQMKKIL